MARPQKAGLDYYPLDTDIDNDDKIALIEAKHGIEGFGVIIKLFNKIYSINGYYCNWNGNIQLLFCKRIGVSFDKVSEILNDAIELGIFDKEIFKKYNVLTSKRIQETYLRVVHKRKEVEIIKEYIVNGINDVRNYDNVVINSINDVNNSINDVNNPQSKVKESKVKESKVNNTSELVNSDVLKTQKTNSPPNRGKKFDDNSIEIELSKYLFEKIRENKPDYKPPNFQSWAQHVDYMIRIDKRKPDVIRQVIEWCQHHSFWYKNILSTEKLREKFDRLELEMQKEKENERKHFRRERKYTDDERKIINEKFYT